EQSTGSQESGWLKSVREEDARHVAAEQKLEDRRQTAQDEFQTKRQEHDKWVAQTQHQGKLVALRGRRSWLTWRWWRSFFQGRTEERLVEFEQREAETRQALAAAESQLRELDSQQELEKQRHATALEQIYAAEVDKRQSELNRQLTTIEGEL